MTAGVTFADVLDRTLANWPLGPQAPPRHARHAPFVASLDGPAVSIHATPYARLAAARHATTPAVTAPPPQPPRPVRVMTAAQRDAARVLMDLGADLPADFTDEELRRAFRALARRWHPDRHPGASPAEHARLARTFAAVMTAYRCLR